MDALQAISERHSTRSFSNKPVPKEALEKIIDAGRRAPNARNEQPWEFIVITHKETLRKIAELTDYGKFIAQAPACVAVFCRKTKYYLEDGCSATENILVASTALGVQSCWVAGDKKPYAPKVARLLGVPEGYGLVSLVALGYASTPGKPTPKRPLSEILHRERF